MTAALYVIASGAAVAGTQSLKLSIDGVIRSQSAQRWADQVRAGTYSEAELAACGYRLPCIDDARRSAYAALDAMRIEAEHGGWWVQLDLVGTGMGWWHYPGSPPQAQARVTGGLDVARSALAAGAPDAFPFRCQSRVDFLAGQPGRAMAHTVMQLGQVQAAGATHLAALGAVVDGAADDVQGAATEGAVNAALDLARVRLAGLTAAPQ